MRKTTITCDVCLKGFESGVPEDVPPIPIRQREVRVLSGNETVDVMRGDICDSCAGRLLSALTSAIKSATAQVKAALTVAVVPPPPDPEPAPAPRPPRRHR